MKTSIPQIEPDSQGRYTCPYKKCGDKEPFKNRSAWYMHYQRVHSKVITVPSKKAKPSSAMDVTTRSNKCKECGERVAFGGMKAHWKDAHSDLPLPNHLKYSYSQRKLAKAKVSDNQPAPAPTVEMKIFSYFCPGCGTPIATALHEETCGTCHMPQGPIQMGVNLAVRQMS